MIVPLKVRKRLHAKVLLADRKMSIGSCNWSENSLKQTERVAFMRLSGREADEEAAFIDALFAAGDELDLSRPTPKKESGWNPEVDEVLEEQ